LARLVRLVTQKGKRSYATRNEAQTCRDLIEPALIAAGWQLERQLRIAPGRVNITGDAMYDPPFGVDALAWKGRTGSKRGRSSGCHG